MYAMNKLKYTGTLYNKLYYKTLGENPELFKSIIKENKKLRSQPHPQEGL